MNKIYFARHGQTVWNVENKICGATDIALTAKGHEQAKEHVWQNQITIWYLMEIVIWNSKM